MKKLMAFLLIIHICLNVTAQCMCGVEDERNMTDLFDVLASANGSNQMVVVSSQNEGDYKAVVECFERTSNGWTRALPQMDAVIGRLGCTPNKKEGDKKAPAGIFSIGTAFGTVDKPSGVKLPYIKTSSSDYWIDDVSSTDYNKWMQYDGDPYSRWESFERLNITYYKYAVVIEYNTNPVVTGDGSAIFFHIWKGCDIGTSGCTAMSENNMLQFLCWLNAEDNPIIIQGTNAMISDMYNLASEKVLYPVRVIVDEKEVVFDVKPRIINNRTIIPARAVFESFEADVSWDGTTETIKILKGSDEIRLKIGSKLAYIGQKQVLLDVEPILLDGRTMIPVRFIAEEFGYSVGWDAKKRVVTIATMQ